jgi:outer membrane protein
MNKVSILAVVALTTFAAAGISRAPLAFADDTVKIGVVDMQKALQTVEQGRKAKAQLEKEYQAKKKELENEEASVRKMADEYKKQSLVLSDEARGKKQGEIQERFMKLQQHTQASQQEMQAREHELTKPIIDHLRAIIGDLAKQRGYSVVLEKNENMVLFSQDKDDFTPDVISAYNKNPTSASLGKSGPVDSADHG